MIIKNDSAVSPVIGVLLMLVVTIIIASVISTFANGMIDTGSKAKIATIEGKYSYSDDLFELTHKGGDTLTTQDLIIKIQQNDADFGGFMSLFSQKGTGAGLIIANMSEIYDKSGVPWLDPSTNKYNLPIYEPGDTGYYNKSGLAKSLSGLSESPVGKSLFMEIDDTNGHIISRQKVMIEP